MTLKKLEEICAGPLFLALCILMSAGAGISLLYSFNLFALLYAIALWLIYAAARKGELQIRQSGLKMISGTVKAKMIVLWVCMGILIAVALILIAISTQADAIMDAVWNSLTEAVGEMYTELENLTGQSREALMPIMGTMLFAVMGVICLFAAGMILLINLFFFRNLHKFTKSVCNSFATGRCEVAKISTVRAWFLVIGIISALSCLSDGQNDLVFFLGNGCICAAYVILFVLGTVLLEQQRQAQSQSILNPPPAPPTDGPMQL